MRFKTKRLILREWNKKDANDLVEGLNNLKVSRWLARIPYPYTKKDANGWIKHCIETAKKDKKRTAYHFAIELKAEKKVIGGMGLEGIGAFQRKARGGVWINEKYHGQGYGVEAYAAGTRFAFSKLKLRRLESGYFKGNISSAKMHKKLGYKIEGKKRKGLKCMATRKIMDQYITGLLKEEWKNKF